MKPVYCVLLSALLIRGGVLLLVPDALTADTDDYRRLAENLVEYGVFGRGAAPTAYRPPLYPLMLVPCTVAGDGCRECIGVLHLLLGVATVGLVYALGRQWGLGRRGSIVAALLVACDPVLLFQSTQIMTETAATFLAAAGLLVLGWMSTATPPRNRNRGAYGCSIALIAGVILSLGALCRPSLLLWIAAVGLVLLLRRPNSRGIPSFGRIAARLRLPAAFALGAAIVLSPWVIRNQLLFGRPIVGTSHGGYTLLLANNPEFYQWLRSGAWGSVWRAERFNAEWERRRPDGELAADRMAYNEARRTIRDEPGTFVFSCLVRAGRFWSPLPHRATENESSLRQSARYAVAVWYVLEYLLAAVGAWLLCRPPAEAAGPPNWLWGLLLVGCLTAVHTIYWTDMRMRAVAAPVVALAAAAALRKR
ncbi:MAG: glycosyltransferase family 39 protein [Pirellulales bacterium]|nr:glycosyltransferase family 39 protein [Pirellulales bacterium]